MSKKQVVLIITNDEVSDILSGLQRLETENFKNLGMAFARYDAMIGYNVYKNPRKQARMVINEHKKKGIELKGLFEAVRAAFYYGGATVKIILKG